MTLCVIFIYIGQDLIVGQDVAELRRRMELLKVIGDSDVLAHAALLGEEGVIKEYLDEYPNDVSWYTCISMHAKVKHDRIELINSLVDLLVC